jgi:death on curing protein
MSDPVEFLDLDDLLELARRLLGDPPPVRDVGLLESAVARPRTTVFGEDAYPDLLTKASALLQSVVKNHALVDGNKRLGWLSTAVFLSINGNRCDGCVERRRVRPGHRSCIRQFVRGRHSEPTDRVGHWVAEERCGVVSRCRPNARGIAPLSAKMARGIEPQQVFGRVTGEVDELCRVLEGLREQFRQEASLFG